MDNFEDNKVKLIESLKRLDFAVTELLEYNSLREKANRFISSDLDQEKVQLKREIDILLEENHKLKKINSKFIEDIDFAIKVTETIITRLKNEDKS